MTQPAHDGKEKDKTEVWQGTLALMVLTTLEALGAQHGFGIARRIEQTSGDRLSVNPGTLYPTLSEARAGGLHHVEVGSVREWPPRALLPADAGGPEAARHRNPPMADDERHRRQVPRGREGAMRAIAAALLRLAGILRLTRSDTEIDEELRSHMMMLADEYRRAGLSDADARRAAAAKFGSLASVAEAYRDRRGVPALEQVARDCRYAARSLGQTRILSASMILVLALGIGVTTTLVTLFHAVAFRALPLPDADRIVKLSLGIAGDVDRRVEGHVSQFSYPELTLYQDTTRALSGVAGFRHETATWFRGGNRRPIAVALVTTNYFNVLQVRPASGRLLTDADRLQPAAVIGHRLWKDAFGQDPAVIGASMLIDRQGYTVIGVAERSFTGTEVDAVDVWVPLAVAAPARGHAQRLVDASLSWLQVVGRLAPGASLKSAAVEAGVIATSYDAMHPGQRTTVGVSPAAALDAGLLQSGSDRTKAIGVGAIVVALGGACCCSSARRTRPPCCWHAPFNASRRSRFESRSAPVEGGSSSNS